MAIKFIPPLENYYSYPVIMIDGTIKELCHVEGRFFTLNAIDVSKDVSYQTIYFSSSKTKI